MQESDVNESQPIDESTTGIENQDSDFTHRRQSMDDFIKKILAEAREEQKKSKVGIPESRDGQRPTDLDSSTSACEATDSNHISKNTKLTHFIIKYTLYNYYKSWMKNTRLSAFSHTRDGRRREH